MQGNTRWFAELLGPGHLQMSSIKAILYEGTTAYQHVQILDLEPFGRCLVLDGKTQSSEADEYVYHEALVHPVLLAHENPKNIFIAGGGEGATLREVLAHTNVETVTMVDIDREVVELCHEHLPMHRGSFDDARTQLVFQDAKLFLQETDKRYDVMVLDLPDPLEGGPAALLYTQDFFQLVRDCLAPDGLMVVQSGTCGPSNYTEIFPAIHNTLETVFPIVVGYQVTVPTFGGPWGFNVASLGPNPALLQSQEIELRIKARITSKLNMYDGISHQGLFSLPKYLRQGLNSELRVITSDNPIFVL